MFINKNTHVQPIQYTAFRKKEIAEQIEKNVIKIVIIKNISSNVQIFNSRFVDEVKNISTNKAYEKSLLILLAYKIKRKIWYYTVINNIMG